MIYSPNQISLKLIDKMDPRGIKTVNEDLLIDFNEILKIKNHKQTIMTNISLSNLFLLLERGDSLTSISRQVVLSEIIELISGSIVSDNIWKYRGLLLNIERAMAYFYLFDKIFQYFGDSNYSHLAYECFLAFQQIFEIAWEIRFPWGFIRPGAMLEPIEIHNIPKIKKILLFQELSASSIAKRIEKSAKLRKQLQEVKILENDEIRKSGITGPINRTLGILPNPIHVSTEIARKSSEYFIQYAYTRKSNLWNLLRVSYAELILALNRISKLLKPFNVEKNDLTKKEIFGDFINTFQTVFGEGYLTVSISHSKVSYFNYIPPQIVNRLGIEQLIEKCPPSIHPLLLLYYQPVITDNLVK